MIKFKNIKILLYFLSLIFIFLSGPNLSSAVDKSLNIIKSGDGFGLVKVSKEGVNNFKCNFNKYKNSSQCKRDYTKNEQITLTAIPSAGSAFIGWGGSCSGIYPCTVILYQNKEVTVYFTEGSSSSSSSSSSESGNYTLTLQKGGSAGGGKVEREGISQYCPMYAENASCSYSYPKNTAIKLIAVPDGGNSFAWSGDGCSGSESTCQITLNSNKTVIADFIPSGEEGPVIESFTSNALNDIVKTGNSAILSGEATNISACNLMSRQDSSLGSYGTPPVIKEHFDSNPILEPYYWRNVGADFTWTTQSLSVNGKRYSYRLVCRGNGAYNNSIIGNGLANKEMDLYTVSNVDLNVTKSGLGSGTVKSDTFSSTFAWGSNGLVSGGSRVVARCSTYVRSHYCNSLTYGSKLYDGSESAASYGYGWVGNAKAFPIYDGLKTGTAKEYTAQPSSSMCNNYGTQSGGTVNEWQCKDKVYHIDCGSICSNTYIYGDNTKVTLTATPTDTNSIFSEWGGGVACEEGTNKQNTCTITMNGHQAKNVDVNFSYNPAFTFFEFTGSDPRTYTVPSGVSKLKITAYGAKGADFKSGKGGMAQGTINVSSGDRLYVYVGGSNGYNGGGYYLRGGGASDVRKGGTELSNRIIVAGGGGGSGADTYYGGAGGGLAGYPGEGPYAGGVGTQTSGGSGGGCYGELCGGSYCHPGLVGQIGIGGNGASGCISGGGGGGGYYGGGGGGDSWQEGDQSSGGGGGSSYVTGLTDSSIQSGVREGNGRVIIEAIK